MPQHGYLQFDSEGNGRYNQDMKRVNIIIFITVNLLVAGVSITGCSTQASPKASEQSQKSVLSDGRFSDPATGCSFTLPSGKYRIELRHFPAHLPADKIRHTIRIYSADQQELARIDLYDNPRTLSPEAWSRRHLSYLLTDRAQLSRQRIGPKQLPALLVKTPRSPQAYASLTAVVSSGKRIAVITGHTVFRTPARLMAKMSRAWDLLSPWPPVPAEVPALAITRTRGFKTSTL